MFASLIAAAALVQPMPPAPPRRIVAGSISDADYPAEAFRAHAEGVVVATIDVDPAGRVTGCRVAQSAGHPALDQRTCQILTERFRFERATGRSGASTRTMRIAWQLPASAVVPFAPSRVVLETAETGRRDFACRISVEGRPPATLMVNGCPAGSDTRPMPRLPTARRMEVTSLSVDGRGLAELRRPRGTLLQQYGASFQVAPDGTVTGCTASGRDADSVAAGQLRCDTLMGGGRPVFEAGGAARRGTISGWTVLLVR